MSSPQTPTCQPHRQSHTPPPPVGGSPRRGRPRRVREPARPDADPPARWRWQAQRRRQRDVRAFGVARGVQCNKGVGGPVRQPDTHSDGRRKGKRRCLKLGGRWTRRGADEQQQQTPCARRLASLRRGCCVAADGFLRSDAPHVGPRHAAKQVHVAVACSQTPLSSQSKSLAQPTLEPLSLLLLSSPRWNRSALLTPLTGEQAVGHSVHETKTSSHL